MEDLSFFWRKFGVRNASLSGARVYPDADHTEDATSRFLGPRQSRGWLAVEELWWWWSPLVAGVLVVAGLAVGPRLSQAAKLIPRRSWALFGPGWLWGNGHGMGGEWRIWGKDGCTGDNLDIEA